MRRIATPPGGLPGSRGSLFLATKFSGIPGELSGKQMQDDLLMSVKSRLGQPIPVTWQPSCVVRVYLPAGSWVHLWSGAMHGSPARGVDITIAAPIGQPAVFYRAGSPIGAELVARLRDEGLLYSN